MKKSRNNKIYFPILAVGCDPQMRIELSESKIYIENRRQFEVYNEISLLKDLYENGPNLVPKVVKESESLNDESLE